jgi:hypothetical protein
VLEGNGGSEKLQHSPTIADARSKQGETRALSQESALAGSNQEEAVHLIEKAPMVHLDPLPEKNLGTLRGGR